jgi:hypothetical protein
MDPAVARSVLGLKGAHDGTGVAGVAHVVQHEHQAGGGDRRHLAHGETHRSQKRLRGTGVRDLAQDPVSQCEDAHAGLGGSRDRSVDRRAHGARGVQVQRLELDRALERGVNEVGTL